MTNQFTNIPTNRDPLRVRWSSRAYAIPLAILLL